MKKRLDIEKTRKLRMIGLLAALLLLVPYIVWHLVKLQVIDAEKYQQMAAEQQTRDLLISPSRGTIYDRNNVVLAVSVTVDTIAVAPNEVKAGTEQAIAAGLSEILDLDYDTVLAKVMKKNTMYQLILRRAEPELADQVRQFVKDTGYNSIKFYEDTKRYYPYANLFSSILGFTSYDNEGEYGLELKYDEVLSGVAGRIVTAKDNGGNSLSFYFEQRLEAQDGYSLRLTTDVGIQQMLEKHLEVAMEENGCAGVVGIVMDVNTGAVLGMAQKGDYDLNDPREIADAELAAQVEALTGDAYNEAYLSALYSQWRNNAIQEPYEPGSVFKIITAAIALEEGTETLDSAFYCPGYSEVDGTHISCWKTAGHSYQTFRKSLENSCNCAFIDIALGIGHETYYSYFEGFGFTDRTGIDMMGEASPVGGVHYHTYDVFSDVYRGGRISLSTYGFGQTFKVTPIQLITAVSAVVNGGYLMEPYVVDALVDANGNVVEQYEPKVVRQVISESTSETMCSLIESVVSTGTGGNAYVAGYRVGGKTGTSEKRDKSIAEGKDFYIASFLGVAPCDDPEVAVLVLLDEPTGELHQGGQIAAPVVGKIMADILPYMGVEAEYTDEELGNMSLTVPLTVGGEVEWAKSVVKDAGLAVKVVGEGTEVTAQYPVSGSKIASNSTVILYCGEEPNKTPVQIPNLSGMTYKEAAEYLNMIGLYLDASGALGSANSSTFTVRSQSPSPEEGTVTFGSVITVDFYASENTGE
ncbi:MAG: PASTA domain-containing protein [Clostridia bacterium]|nr:PASTA domain-containing protein [Clostridia bacterium]